MKSRFLVNNFLTSRTVSALAALALAAGSTACAPEGPAALSPVGFAASAPVDGVVTVTAAPRSGSSNLKEVHLRIRRGGEVLHQASVPWAPVHSSGFEIRMGTAEKPVRLGDELAVGTSPLNTHFMISVPGSGSF